MSRPEQGQRSRQLGDFAVVDHADSSDLVGRLDVMQSLAAFRTYKAQTFQQMRIAPGMTVADVGCGTGGDVAALGGQVGPTGRVIGFDLSQSMLDQAIDRYAGEPNLSFKAASADGLDAGDATIDAIRADRVLIHVPDPQAAIAEMVRVVKPGGRIVISEPDMHGCWVASSHPELSHRVMRRIADSCRHPYLPRDLIGLFSAAGLEDISLSVYPLTVFEPSAVAKILDFTSVLADLVQEGEVAESVAQAWGEDMTRRAETGRFAAGVAIMIASGTRP